MGSDAAFTGDSLLVQTLLEVHHSKHGSRRRCRSATRGRQREN